MVSIQVKAFKTGKDRPFVMNREAAEQVIAAYQKSLYGFALKRCAGLQDAEDLAQEICLRLYRTLLLREDIEDVERFIWTVAHNAQVNYYRGRQRAGIGIGLEEMEEPAAEEDLQERVSRRETEDRLRSEIARLSAVQRRVVTMYYFENKKLEEIAGTLAIPLGTVKWHLFEAKKDLKKGMTAMRNASELKFNPIRFSLCGISGSPGTKGDLSNFFRSTLVQNIAYCTWRRGKTVNEIADALGVSPVYVESEAEALEEFGLLMKKEGRYWANILLDEPTAEWNAYQSEIYSQAAALVAGDLAEELLHSGILDSEGVICPDGDRNFALWALIPYLAATGGEALREETVSFEEAATLRPDGGCNIVYASVQASDVTPPLYFEDMQNWCGPCWNSREGLMLWQIDNAWTAKRVDERYPWNAARDMELLARFLHGGSLSPAEYACLAEGGYVKPGMAGTDWRKALRIVRICDDASKKALLETGDRVKERHWPELKKLREEYQRKALADTPHHLRKALIFSLQHMFFSDGWFLLHCLKWLIDNGILQPPAEEQKKSLITLLLPA